MEDLDLDWKMPPGVERFDEADILGTRMEGIGAAYLYRKIFWPEFVTLDGFVFLAIQYDRDYYDQTTELIGSDSSSSGARGIEGTINTIYLNLLFGDGPVLLKVIENVGNLMAETWKTKASTEFPDKTFQTEFQWYGEDGETDPGLTLFQVNKRA